MKPIDDAAFLKAMEQINSAATIECLWMLKSKLDQIVMVLNDHSDRLDEMEDAEVADDATEEEEAE